MSSSAARILAQSVGNLLNGFPGWRQPVHCRAQATVGATGAVTMVAAKTTPGLAITRSTTGVYDLTFPPCRDATAFVFNIRTAAPETASNIYYAVIEEDDTVTLASLGTVRFRSVAADDGVDEDGEDGSRIDITFWADLG
jgi:hypothetical protein